MELLFIENMLYLDTSLNFNFQLNRLILNNKTYKFIFMDVHDDTVVKMYTGKFILDNQANKLILFYKYDVNPYAHLVPNPYKKINLVTTLDFEIVHKEQIQHISKRLFRYTISFSKSPVNFDFNQEITTVITDSPIIFYSEC